jgi:prepilin-type N-terminal cleavage/methylation domain-containing protein
MKNKQKGFTVVEVLMVLVIVLLVGFAGWYVWNQRDKSDDKSTSTSTNKSADDAHEMTPEQSPTYGWKTYTNKEGMYTFKHPSDWVFADHLDWCAEGLALFASKKSAVGTCASENGGQMSMYGADGDLRGQYKLGEGYVGVTEKKVTADGVEGVKISGIASGQAEGLGAYEDGTNVIYYVFYTNVMTYVAGYVHEASFPDDAITFEMLVTDTLTFDM